MKLLPRAIPEGWDVIEGGGEGLTDPKDRATLRANLNCVAGENVADENVVLSQTPTTAVTKSGYAVQAILAQIDGKTASMLVMKQWWAPWMITLSKHQPELADIVDTIIKTHIHPTEAAKLIRSVLTA